MPNGCGPWTHDHSRINCWPTSCRHPCIASWPTPSAPLNTCQSRLFIVLACCCSTRTCIKLTMISSDKTSAWPKGSRGGRAEDQRTEGRHMSSNLWAAPMRMQQISVQQRIEWRMEDTLGYKGTRNNNDRQSGFE